MDEQMVRLAMNYRCPYCGAYGWCKTETGKRARDLHSDRTWPLLQMYGKGYDEGLRDGRESVPQVYGGTKPFPYTATWNQPYDADAKLQQVVD